MAEEGPYDIMMEYSHRMSLKYIWNHFAALPLSHLATVEGDQPRVRMMTLVTHKGRLWLATKTEWDKVSQLLENPKIELTVPAKEQNQAGCVRITALANIVEDDETRKAVSSAIPWFSNYWTSHHDENFTLIGLDLTRVLFDHPSDGLKYTVDVNEA